MCELTFVNTHRKDLNALVSANQILENTRSDNKDGWGIFTRAAGIGKTCTRPWDTRNFGIKIRSMITDQPALIHVRSASRGTDVKVEFNHPFETERLVLAHNGTLTPKSEDKLKEYEGKLDSEMFLLELDKDYLALPASEDRLVKALNSAMERFTGKFAFLIFEKETEQWYAARGKTADLHISYVLDAKDEENILGYVINTQKRDLEIAFDQSIELMHMLNKPNVPLISVVQELESESIYSLKHTDIVKIADIKQNFPVVEVAVRNPNLYGGYNGGYTANQAWRRAENKVWGIDLEEDDDDSPFSGIDVQAAELDRWMGTYGLTIEDLDTIMGATLGVSLLCCDQQDIDVLKKYVLPKLQCDKHFRGAITKKINKHGSYWMFDVYREGKFQFPYMLETRKKEFMSTVSGVLVKIHSGKGV